MNFEQLFLMQQQLNERIVNKYNLHDKELYEEHLFALIVELGELANETRCFKYWSIKPPSPRNVILEEYVDGFHFILSLGLDLNINKNEISFIESTNSEKTVIEQFLSLYKIISQLQVNKSKNVYLLLLSNYLDLGYMLGFTNDDIVTAYFDKNAVNHERQDTGY
ncbi:dUTP diphosphatase [Fictibacillus arsenicus]|uniref:dUTPase n=1 Tax=Fictibacillus arsenicus TaxID=255247 RepID=A0A1V3GAG8_9BACL|nr:dUTP diphosphatase [Fictibacillus arsenicus]OOE13844.1 dUTPase [Fictibacillus arsenicus]